MADNLTIRVTVITVTFNNRVGLERTMRSVRARERRLVEFIVIDGGSTDKTRDLLESGQANADRWVSERDRGIYDAMNKGLAMASGEFVCFMNAGDVFSPGMLDTLLDRYDEWKGADVVYGDMENELAGAIDKAQPVSRIHRDMVARHQAMLIRTSLHRRFPFDTRYRVAADYDALLRMYLVGARFLQLDLCFGSYEPGGVSNSRYFGTIAEYARVLSARTRGIARIARPLGYLWGKRKFMTVLALQRVLGAERYRRAVDRLRGSAASAGDVQP